MMLPPIGQCRKCSANDVTSQVNGGGFTVREPYREELTRVRALMLRVIELDDGYGYNPRRRFDLDDLQGFYLDNPRQALVGAVGRCTCARLCQ